MKWSEKDCVNIIYGQFQKTNAWLAFTINFVYRNYWGENDPYVLWDQKLTLKKNYCC